MSLKRESNNHRYNSHNYREKQDMEELTDARIITKNLVYIIGLSSNIANKDKLNKYEYLGQYGNIIKIVVNKNKAYNQNSPHGPSYSAYVTFSKASEASIAILSLDNKMIDNHLIRASFGTTKYCSFFLKGIECNNKECLFLHKWADENDIIKRGDLISNKVIFTQQHSYAIKIADIHNEDVKKKILSSKKKGKTVFPSPDIIYTDIIKEKKLNNSKAKKNSDIKNESIIKGKINSPLKDNKINKDIKEKTNKNKSNNDEESFDEEEENEEDEEYENEEDKSINSNEEKNKKQNNINKDDTNKTQQNKKRKKILLNREKSRFDFCVKNNEEKTNIIVPEHILNIINKKINSYNLTKYMQPKLIDKFFLDESIKNNNEVINDEWTKFINDNIDMCNYNSLYNNDEFMDDIDNINDFILNKITTKPCSGKK